MMSLYGSLESEEGRPQDPGAQDSCPRRFPRPWTGPRQGVHQAKQDLKHNAGAKSVRELAGAREHANRVWLAPRVFTVGASVM